MSTQNSGKAGSAVGALALATIRRIYFYSIALIGLIVALASLDTLLQFLAGIWLAEPALLTVEVEGYLRNGVARSGGILLVAAPVFLIHWYYIQHTLRSSSEGGLAEMRAALRKFFLYVATAVALIYLFVNGFRLISEPVQLTLGRPLADVELWPNGWLHRLLVGLAGLGLALYLQQVARSDGDYGRERGGAGTLRRLYQALLGLSGVGLLLFGSARLLEIFWQLVLPVAWLSGGADWWRVAVGDGAAALILGALLWRINWLRWSRITAAHEAEAQTALRRFYLYAAVVASALATLVPAANVLREGLLLLFGSGSGAWADIFQKLTLPLAFMPVGSALWRWHWLLLSREAAEYGESPAGATVRRLYYYLVAATGLGLLWFGLVELVQMALDLVAVAPGSGGAGPLWAQPLATGLSLLAVGAPIWTLHWRAVQQVARGDDAAATAERSSSPRRAYLYGVALVGALLILFYLASVVYRLLLVLLGEPQAGFFSAETVRDLASSLIAAIFWTVHLLAIRRDGALDRLYGGRAIDARSTAGQRQALETQIRQLEEELAELRVELAALPENPRPGDSQA